MANWYAYIGIGDPTQPTSYRIANVKPTCQVGSQICAIYLNQVDNVPNALDGTTTYIVNALLTQTPQPTGIGIKRFVYLKCACD